MWSCHKCGKPVFFAERKQSLGYDWHPECLRCEECGKRLNPGQHAEHKGVPYCHVPCYGALFGPQLFGHGTRVESHKNFGLKGIPRAGGGGLSLPRDHLESKLKVYNQFFNNKSMEIRSREVNNRLILEGALRVYWGVQGVIHLKEDDDQRMLVIRKRNSCRASGSEDGGINSEKDNEITKSVEEPTSTAVDGYSTDISLSESMVFDSCSLNEYPISELPTTPEEVTAATTGNSCDTSEGNPTSMETSISTSLGASDSQLSSAKTKTASCASLTLPSKLDGQLEWDEIDELLQVERRFDPKDNNFETMPVKLPSSQQSSVESSPTKTISAPDSCSDSTTTSGPSTTNGEEKSSNSSTSSDNFITASASLTTATTATTTTIDDYETDDATLKPIDFEDFKRSVHQDYVNGANDFTQANSDSLKRNQPIDPSRINDSLKLYGENPMSKSFNCEHALRSIDACFINDTLNLKGGAEHQKSINRMYALQKSGSASSELHQPMHINHGRNAFEIGINRSKSGPTCFDFSDSDEDSTLKPTRPSTIRRSNVSPRYVNIDMNCYPRKNGKPSTGAYSKRSKRQVSSTTSECDSSLIETTNATRKFTKTNERSDSPTLHVTEDGVVLRRPPKTGSTAIKRRSGNKRSRTKLKRRCSINGHYYNRETSFFTPPYGSQMSVWVTSLVTTQEVINLILEKYKVDSSVENFSLFVIRDNGEQKRLSNQDYPLISRVMLGPHEDVARLFLVDAKKTQEISNEVAQFLNLSIPECRAILDRYDEELEREVIKVREKYSELRRRIISRMDSLKVRL